MRRALTTALLAPIVLVAACSTAPASPPPAPPAQMVTVTVAASGVGTMVYTDPASPTGVTSANVGQRSVKSAKITVPKGTTVRVSTSQPGPVASCWISDATDQLTFTRGTDTCTAVAN